jgi:hypothetical protein
MSVFDYDLILRKFDVERIRDAFVEPEKSTEHPDVTDIDDLKPNIYLPFGTARPSLISVLYISLIKKERQGDGLSLGWLLEKDVEIGIERALTKLGEHYHDVNVEVTIDLGEPLEDLADSDLHDLDNTTIDQLFKAGLIGDSELGKARVRKSQKESSED